MRQNYRTTVMILFYRPFYSFLFVSFVLFHSCGVVRCDSKNHFAELISAPSILGFCSCPVTFRWRPSIIAFLDPIHKYYVNAGLKTLLVIGPSDPFYVAIIFHTTDTFSFLCSLLDVSRIQQK